MKIRTRHAVAIIVGTVVMVYGKFMLYIFAMVQ